MCIRDSAFTFSKVSDDVDELANSAIPLSESEYEELEPGGGDENVAILLLSLIHIYDALVILTPEH